MESYPLVSISIINYNDRKFIFKAIESAVSSDYPNLEIIITDNNSTDGTREEIEGKISFWRETREEVGKKYAHLQTINEIKYIKNVGNDGFGKPHNAAIRTAKGEFILLLNSDAILTPDFVGNAIKPFRDEKVGAVQGKLLRYDFKNDELFKSKEDSKLNVIDTTGLKMLKNRRIICIGQGEADRGQYEEQKEIFGADGAVPVYRKSALEDVKMEIMESGKSKMAKEKPESGNRKVEGGRGNVKSEKTNKTTLHFQSSTFQKYEYFDEDFFMYKEDVDLAWRLRLYGWKSVYNPQAVAYHGRGSGDSMATNYISIIRERRKINVRAKYLSFKHQRLMQIKNEMPSLLLKHFGTFVVKEIGAWAYMIIFERFTIRVLRDFHATVPKFLKKRKIVMKNKNATAKEMERWFE